MSAAPLAARLTDLGFRVRLWRDRRIYLSGYGADISAYLDIEACGDAPVPDNGFLDAGRLHVVSRWRSTLAGARALSVRHIVLTDLFRAGLVAEPPPADWRRLRLPQPGSPVSLRPARLETSDAMTGLSGEADSFDWPDFRRSS